MILIIDTIDRNLVEIGIYNGLELRVFEFETEKQSEELLIILKGILKKENFVLEDIEKILVNQGPGSYTGVRVGVTVANTLGWALDIPVFGYKDCELDSALLKIAKLKIKNLPAGRQGFSKIVLPFYQK